MSFHSFIYWMSLLPVLIICLVGLFFAWPFLTVAIYCDSVINDNGRE